MRRFIENLRRNEKVQIIGYVAGTFLICVIIMAYLLNSDISQAPVYIYSQF